MRAAIVGLVGFAWVSSGCEGSTTPADDAGTDVFTVPEVFSPTCVPMGDGGCRCDGLCRAMVRSVVCDGQRCVCTVNGMLFSEFPQRAPCPEAPVEDVIAASCPFGVGRNCL